MVRFYLVPVVELTDDTGTVVKRGPAYFGWRGGPAPLVTAPWEARDYGAEPLMLLAADLTDPDDVLLTGQSGVVKFADNLDTQLKSGLSAMQDALEALHLPASMLTRNTTYRQVIRGIMGIFGIAQCMQGKGFNIFAGSVTLATTMAEIPATPRNALADCVTSLGYDISAVTGSTTVRQLLVGIANAASPSPMMDVTI